MRPRDRLETTPWSGAHPWRSLFERLPRTKPPLGAVPESWVAGLEECVGSGYLNRPESILLFCNPSLLGELAPSVTKEHGDGGLLDFGMFVAWCSELRRVAIADFPDVDTPGDPDPEVTMLARCLEVAMTAPSWSHYASPRLRRVLARRVSGRLVSEVPDLVDLARAARRGPGGRRCASMRDGLALNAIWRWQDAVLDDVERMGAEHGLWYRVLDTWRTARMVTGRPVPERVLRWLEKTQAPPRPSGRRSSKALAGWRSARLVHGLSLLQEGANEASEHHGAIQVAAALLGLEPGAVAGYWGRRKRQCTGWPVLHRLPVMEMYFLCDAPRHVRAIDELRV